MSYISKKGREAAESAMSEGSSNVSKALKTFKSGTTYKVRVPSISDFVEYFNHSVFKVFYSCPCTRANGEPDAYDKAVDLLYQDADKAKKAGDEPLAEELRKQAYTLKAKPRYLFGFFNLEDGEPLIIDVSKKQAQVLILGIEKFAKKLNKVAFEISKTGSGQSTTVSIMPVLDMDDDLSKDEQKAFETTKDKDFDDDIYGKVLKVKTEDEQIADLRAFGFDVSRLGYDNDEAAPIDDADEDPSVNF